LITLPSSIFFRLAIDANVDAIIPEIGSNSQAFNRVNFEVNSWASFMNFLALAVPAHANCKNVATTSANRLGLS